PVCTACEKKLEYVTEPVCKKCGKPIENEQQEYCYDCKKHNKEYQQGKAVWVHKGEVKASIYRFKYQNRQEYARYYAQEMVRIYGRWITSCCIDGIVPIPIHKSKRRQRGYNQAELIAREIGRTMGIAVYPDLLIRVRKTKAQKELNEQERKKNLKKAFIAKENKVQLSYILLVDDIYTTGSTMNEAANELKSTGVTGVYCICVSIGRGY
ncbi:MAG: ComF family protein, partial [Lachnospiraceae bacterium]